MKQYGKGIFIFLLLFNIFWAPCLMADEVHTKNGDRISGEILNMMDGKLIIKTNYAGEIGITWTEITDIKTDKEISVLLSNETLIKGSPRGFEQDKMIISTTNVVEPITFSMADVKSINPPDEPSVKIKIRANVGITHSSGNTEKDTRHFDGEFSARTEKNRYTAGGEYNRTEDSGIKTESKSMGYVKYDHFISKKWFAYMNGLFEKDRFKDLSLRSAFGIGSGYQFYETPVTNLSLETGLNYVDEDYIVAPDKSYSSGRWAVNYDRYFYDKAFQLFHFHEGFVSLEDADDMFINSRTGIRIPLYEHFNATLQYNVNWTRTPSPGREKKDTMLMFTLGYQLEN